MTLKDLMMMAIRKVLFLFLLVSSVYIYHIYHIYPCIYIIYIIYLYDCMYIKLNRAVSEVLSNAFA